MPTSFSGPTMVGNGPRPLSTYAFPGVQAGQTTAYYNPATTQYQGTPVQTQANNNGSNGGGAPPPSNNNSAPSSYSRDGFTFPSEADYMGAVDSAFGDQNNYLNQAEANINKDYPTIQQDITGQFNTNSQLADTAKGTALNQIGTTETQGNRATEDALSKARRIFQEQQIGSQQRFGGSSSAGQASSELLNRNLQSEQGQTQRQHIDFIQQIGQQKQAVEQKHQDTLLQLEQQKQTALNQAQRDFQAKLLEITNNRTQLSTAKAQAKLQALMDLRNKTFAIQQQNQQFQQALELQKSQAQLQLDAYAKQAQGAASSAQGYGTQLGSNLSGQNYGLATTAPGTQLQQPQYIGSIGKSVTGRDPNGNFLYNDGTQGPGGFLNQ